jgi:hypothetical protein
VRHFLAYGNSDQASFRRAEILATFDFLTVPGTIASYYADATAGFVLTADKPYLIDPRTPLLQGDISRPKASHLTLATWLGPTVEQALRSVDGGPILLSPAFFSDAVVAEMAAELVSRQQNYGHHGGAITKKLDRYRRLRAEARGESLPSETQPTELAAPDFVLAPYFATGGFDDPWWETTLRVWAACEALTANVCGVVAVTSPAFLRDALQQVPESLAETGFFWITGFDERRASVDLLALVASAIAENKDRAWVNLYGGFFSVCLHYVGLWGFNNGLGYSESRNWPDLATTGAAPPRYYVPRLHAFMSPAAAQLVLDSDPFFACPCAVCAQVEGRILHLPYRGFREHFALTRAWEIGLVQELTPGEVAQDLSETLERFRQTVAPSIPQTLIPDLRHLGNWSHVLGTF